MGLKTFIVESDNGYIGGEYCHEFIVESDTGESKFLTDGKNYYAHEDVAKFKRDENLEEREKPLEEVEAVRGLQWKTVSFTKTSLAAEQRCFVCG